MRHESSFMRLPALWIANFGQRSKHAFHEVRAILLLTRWEYRHFVLASFIKKNRGHRLLLEM
jgi:hypothetical protein